MVDEARVDDGEMPVGGESPESGNVTPITRVESPAEGPSRLRDAMRRARMNEADRRDVVISLRESELARLEMLQDALSDVFADIPEDSDLFDGQILPGNPPRLWIDVLAYVVMDRDRRTYSFVQETRHGRATLLESPEIDQVSQRVTDYIAARLLERKRAIAQDGLTALQARLARDPDQTDQPAEPAGPFGKPELQESRSESATRTGASGWQVFTVFLLGVILGAFGLFFYGVTQYTP